MSLDSMRIPEAGRILPVLASSRSPERIISRTVLAGLWITLACSCLFEIKAGEFTNFTSLLTLGPDSSSVYPEANLIEGSDGKLYGTSKYGGAGNCYDP